MTHKLIILLFTFSCLYSCISYKNKRLLKKEAREKELSSILLSAYQDTPLNGIFLKLRKDGSFEHSSSGLFKFCETGDWSIQEDTISLFYLNDSSEIYQHKKLIIDRTCNTLNAYENPLDPSMRMRITINMF